MLQEVVLAEIAERELRGIGVPGDLRRNLVQAPRELRVDVQGVHEAIYGLLLREVLSVVREKTAA